MSNLSFYVHIPYCVKRCGYCDFNTYTPAELREGGTLETVSQGFVDSLIAEVTFASRTSTTTIPTIFFGGGTPSLMPAQELGRVIELLKQRWEFTSDIEITMECNPDTLTLQSLEEYRAIGINRISMGMQSANQTVLQVLDRTHNPENVAKSVENARKAGFDNIEDGTKLSAKIKRGEINKPDDDLMAQMYLSVDDLASKAGLTWYELSNWGRPAAHNLVYWQNQNWWGLGPGAHSHIDGTRWWNVKHPSKYQEKLAAFESPMQDREVLGETEKRDEKIMLQIRLREGIAKDELTETQLKILENYPEQVMSVNNRLVLTPQGRLIADRIVRELI
ncbi:MAG: radical SAM protein [Actinobacteria bacterium]|nr:radical SAM protein [Actinomycetota bacterium]